MPIFVRTGSILTLSPVVDSTKQLKNMPLDIRIYPGQNGTFTLYEDEGDSYHYEKGVYSRIPFSWSEGQQTLTIGERKGNYPGMAPERRFRIILEGEGNGVGRQSNGAGIEIRYSGRPQIVSLLGRASKSAKTFATDANVSVSGLTK
jgi:alpha-D-xyloside xylohydrolase